MFVSEIGLTFCVYSLALFLVHKNNLKIPFLKYFRILELSGLWKIPDRTVWFSTSCGIGL